MLEVETSTILTHFFSTIEPWDHHFLALLLAVVWMLRDDKDRARRILVFSH